MPTRKIQMSIPADLKYSSVVRNIAEEIFTYVKFSKAWASRLKLVTDELFMNAVKYGSDCDECQVYLTFEYDDQKVIFRIEDEGKGNNRLTAEELKKKILQNASKNDVARTSGRGLAMIANLWTDKIDIAKSAHGGIAVVFEKHIEKAEAPPPPMPPMPPVQPESAPAPQVPASVATPDGPTFEIKLSGEIDQFNLDATAAPVFAQIEGLPEGSTLQINMKDVVYFNSTFIGHLAAWHNLMNAKQGRVVVLDPTPATKEVLELVGLDRIITIKYSSK